MNDGRQRKLTNNSDENKNNEQANQHMCPHTRISGRLLASLCLEYRKATYAEKGGALESALDYGKGFLTRGTCPQLHLRPPPRVVESFIVNLEELVKFALGVSVHRYMNAPFM